MRRFRCDRCRSPVDFEADRCGSCRVSLGYVPDQLTVCALVDGPGPTTYEADGSDRTWWRCLNAAWGCNWMVPVDVDGVWCRSCRLTRGRPDEARPEAIATWISAEAAKRRLVHQLDALGLPVEPRSPAHPDGLAFDLVHLPGVPEITGHRDGVITLDLSEADDRHRDEVRHRLHESFRTVIGHLRHEIGHHYWLRLVGRTHRLTAFRRLFGDERADYADALADHYATVPAARHDGRCITSYAASHPLEDWAESFAHYLHIRDAAETALDRGLTIDPGGVPRPPSPFRELVQAWRVMAGAMNAVADSLGAPAVYPFELTDDVVAKLDFVHQRVVEHTVAPRIPGTDRSTTPTTVPPPRPPPGELRARR